MGVTDLWELANRCGKTVSMEDLSKQRLAVDTSVWLVQFVRGMRTEDGGPLENAHVRGIFSRVCKMLFYGIRPVFVFDGDKPALKKATLAARAEARAKMERQEQVTARELLIARVKRKLLTLVDENGKELSEAEVRRMVAKIDAAAREDENAEPFVLPPFVPKLAPRKQRVEELAAREALGEQLREYEESAQQLSVSESGLLFSNLQVVNMVRSLQRAGTSSTLTASGEVRVLTREVRSDPGRQLVLTKGPSIAVPAPKKPSAGLLFVADDVVVGGGAAEGEQGVEFEDSAEEQRAPPEPPAKKAKVLPPKEKEEADEVVVERLQIARPKKVEPVVFEEEDEAADAVVEMAPSVQCKVCSWMNVDNVARCSMCGYSLRGEAKADEAVDEDLAAFLEGEDEIDECPDERGKWACRQCSFLNARDGKVCEMCGMQKDQPPPPPELVREATATTWTCELCTWPNSIALLACEICGGKEAPRKASTVTLTAAAPAPVAPIAVSSSGNFVAPGDEESASHRAEESAALGALREELDRRKEGLQAEGNAQRRMLEKVDDAMIAECKDLLKLFGIPWVAAPMEAEAQCASLELLGLVDGVVTEDSDVFLVGASNVYKNLFRAAANLQRYRMSDVNSTLGMSRTTFIQLAYFLGSDYTIGIKSVGVVLAVEILSEFCEPQGDEEEEEEERDELEQVLLPLRAFRDWFLNPDNDEEMASRAKLLRKRLKKVELPEDFPDAEIARAYLHPTVDDSTEAFVWGRPNWEELKRFALSKMMWSEDRAKSVLDPICNRLRELDALGKMTTQTSIMQFFESLPKEIPLQINSVRLAKAIARFKGEEYVPDPALAKSRKPGKRAADEPAKKKIKRARSAYSYFMAEELRKRRKENPEMEFSDIAKSCSVQWKLLEDKSQFDALAKADRKRKERELEEEEDEEQSEGEGNEEENEEADEANIGEEELVVEAVSATRGKSIDEGPPFDREVLEKTKMGSLRLLCHKFGLKPSLRKVDVVAQLCMLTAAHVPISELRFQEKLSSREQEELRMSALDKLLE